MTTHEISTNINNTMLADNNKSQTEKNSTSYKLLPPDFKPSRHTVIVGRGKEPTENPGNKRLRAIAMSFLEKYQKEDKRTKSRIVSDIISMIYEACPNGGAFVKHSKNGNWYEVGPSAVREKVGYVFRDLLADEYKSSSKSKVARRQRGHHQEYNDESSSVSSSSDETVSYTTTSMSSSKNNTTTTDQNYDSIEPLATTTSNSIAKNMDRPTIKRQSSVELVFDHFHFGRTTGILFQDDIFRDNDGNGEEKKQPKFLLLDDEDFDYESLLKCPLMSE